MSGDKEVVCNVRVVRVVHNVRDKCLSNESSCFFALRYVEFDFLVCPHDNTSSTNASRNCKKWHININT